MRHLGHQVMPNRAPGHQGPFRTRAPGHCFPYPGACAELPPTCSLPMWCMAILFGACMGTIVASAKGGPQANTLVLGSEAKEPRALHQASWYLPVRAHCHADAR